MRRRRRRTGAERNGTETAHTHRVDCIRERCGVNAENGDPKRPTGRHYTRCPPSPRPYPAGFGRSPLPINHTVSMPSAEIALPPRRRGRGGARTRTPRSGDYGGGSDARRRKSHTGEVGGVGEEEVDFAPFNVFNTRFVRRSIN